MSSKTIFVSEETARDLGIEREVEVRIETAAVYTTYTLNDGTTFTAHEEPSEPDMQDRLHDHALNRTVEYAEIAVGHSITDAMAKAVKDAKSLDSLCAALNSAEDYAHLNDCGSCGEFLDVTSLQTFGGEEPSDTRGIYSWNETDLLMTDCNGRFVVDRRPVAEAA